MLKRYGEKALKESAARADELESRGAKTPTGRGRVFRLC
jgi:hypothetical protein